METTELSPVVVGSFVLFSIFDDSDPMYHSDSVTGQTPAMERRDQPADEKTQC